MRKRNIKSVNQKIKKITEEYCRKRNKLNVELQDAMDQERWAEARRKRLEVQLECDELRAKEDRERCL